MPNRILRDWTDSDKINQLSPQAERFFIRLIMKVDDFGRFWADPRLLKANLFPLLLDDVRGADIARWTAECEKAGLLVSYSQANKAYVQITRFEQRLRQKRERFPAPPEIDSKSTCQSNDGQMTVNGRLEVETNLETKRNEYAPNGDAFIDFLKSFTSITGKKFRSPGKAKKQYSERLKEGFSPEEIISAIKNCFSDPYHRDNPNYLTPEFITRADKLEKYINYTRPKTGASGSLNGFPDRYNPEFERKLQGKQMNQYWNHLRERGLVPKKNSQGVVIDWVPKQSSA